MNDAGQIVLVVAAIVLGGLLALVVARQLVRVPGRIRRTYRPEQRAIRVIGVGGGGSNAVDRMVAARIPGVRFVAVNTDAQALRRSRAPTKVRIGDSTTGGLGSGGDPGVGRKSAEENEAKITRVVAGADLIFITAGLGGGTGSGAAPIVGAAARFQGALTIAVVTKPFGFEGAQRQRVADSAMVELAKSVDAIIAIPNDRLADVVAEDASMLDAFRVVDDVLLEVARGIIDLLRGTGLVNLDFADVRTVMHGAGPTVIGLGRGIGENRAVDAARQAVASPLLEASIRGARGILFNVSGPEDLQLREVLAAADEIRTSADPDANVIFGASLSRRAGEEVLITLIATGLEWPEGSEVAARAKEGTLVAPKVAERAAPAAGPVGAGSAGAPGLAPTPGHEASSVERQAVGARPAAGGGPPADTPTDQKVDLDVPSFLRQQQSP